MAVDVPWRIGPLLRLFGGVLVSVFLGSLVALALRYPPESIQRPLLFGVLLLGSGASLLVALWMVAGPWPPEGLKQRAFLFAALVYAGIALSAGAQELAGAPAAGTEALQLAITTLSFQGAVVILVGRLIQEHGLRWAQAFGFRRRWVRAAGIGFLCAFSILPVAWGLQYASVQLMSALDWHPEVQHAVNVFQMTGAWSDRLMLGLVALGLAPVAEELLFRGVMYPALKTMGFPRFAFWSTAMVFALIHFNVATFLPLLAFACVLNILYERTGNLLSCMVAHASFNGINLGMILVTRRFFDQMLSG